MKELVQERIEREIREHDCAFRSNVITDSGGR